VLTETIHWCNRHRVLSLLSNLLSKIPILFLSSLGSRWTNIHMGAKTKTEYLPPPPPKGFSDIADHAEQVSYVGQLYNIHVQTLAN
jgi:hypothetical protein